MTGSFLVDLMLFCLNTECQYINRSATVVVVVEAVATVVVVASGSLLIVVVGASPLFEDSVVVVVMLSLLNVVVPMAWRSVFETRKRWLCRKKKLANLPLEECPRLTPLQHSLVVRVR